jgi:hypothetical protein
MMTKFAVMEVVLIKILFYMYCFYGVLISIETAMGDQNVALGIETRKAANMDC